jgi:hypothetical protein
MGFMLLCVQLMHFLCCADMLYTAFPWQPWVLWLGALHRYGDLPVAVKVAPKGTKLEVALMREAGVYSAVQVWSID